MRVTSALLFTTMSRKPGSWCVNPLWSCRQTVEVMSRFSDGTFARHEAERIFGQIEKGEAGPGYGVGLIPPRAIDQAIYAAEFGDHGL